MPVNPEDRTTVVLGADLIRAARERAQAEGRGFSAVVADAVSGYLAHPAPAPAAVPSTPGVSAGVVAELHAMLGTLRELLQLLPEVRRVVDDHDEVMDTLDQLAAEIGRREGAAHALEEVRAVTDGRNPGR